MPFGSGFKLSGASKPTTTPCGDCYVVGGDIPTSAVVGVALKG